MKGVIYAGRKRAVCFEIKIFYEGDVFVHTGIHVHTHNTH
jgi:hypothetical protein